jgi:hypothetical protein
MTVFYGYKRQVDHHLIYRESRKATKRVGNI